ncbi:unnamed protein product [Effrenium voratum]|uniref:Uncharacterized protein n=1 Tax=Effrenium voratum TaxID=2562239 RepID=A0AA36NHA1_9DINO|nr:unnamed protein product [Effrenium voratum]
MGEFHGLALSASGRAFCWGQEQGPELVLAQTTMKESKMRLPRSLGLNQPTPRALDLLPVTAVAAGGYHSAVITQDGRLWTWGSNDYGQLGLGLARELLPVAPQPRPVELPGRAWRVSLGGVHSAVIDEDRRLYTFGSNRKGQCGQGEAQQLVAPEPLALPKERPVRAAACGGFFSFFEAEGPGNELYACGWGKDGSGKPVGSQPPPREAPSPYSNRATVGAHICGAKQDALGAPDILEYLQKPGNALSVGGYYK